MLPDGICKLFVLQLLCVLCCPRLLLLYGVGYHNMHLELTRPLFLLRLCRGG